MKKRLGLVPKPLLQIPFIIYRFSLSIDVDKPQFLANFLIR